MDVEYCIFTSCYYFKNIKIIIPVLKAVQSSTEAVEGTTDAAVPSADAAVVTLTDVVTLSAEAVPTVVSFFDADAAARQDRVSALASADSHVGTSAATSEGNDRSGASGRRSREGCTPETLPFGGLGGSSPPTVLHSAPPKAYLNEPSVVSSGTSSMWRRYLRV
ncbi:hypothetical protein PC116_g25059 [Phytophthora cactorum]|nr:hypothetical protein PC128_g21233 [Phytophthora cactorum]KAG4226533.1 hypothetical protein PC116_g25059 [Phytophthora cactorum]